jgi:aminoglycoside phosphotransferase (APT) family kinase protein
MAMERVSLRSHDDGLAREQQRMRPDEPDDRLTRAIVDRIFHPHALCQAERVAEGVSTWVYRIRRGAETFYLRVLPEADASFAPEALAHQLLRARGVRVPEVIHVEHRDPLLDRSVMVTREIPGRHLGAAPAGDALKPILVEAGRQLALINTIPVDGFGWIKRDTSGAPGLEAVHPTLRAFLCEHLSADLTALAHHELLDRHAIARIERLVADRPSWLEAKRATLAHGDFDVTQIFQQEGRYTGIIDFGEIRGADRWYDLGHFAMHDAETLPIPVLHRLLAGYDSVTPLPADARQRIAFASLLIAVRALARCLERRPGQAVRHRARISIPRDLALLAD